MKGLKWINAGAFAAMVSTNALANLLPIGGKTTGQISEAYPNLFTPAPITFSIWGLIYLLMTVFIIYQFGAFDNGIPSTEMRERIGLLFPVSCILNIAWLCLWHSNMIELSTVCIILLLITLIVIVHRIKETDGSFVQLISVKVGFSLYYGWIIAATIANISVMLTKIGWNGWGLSDDFWTAAVLLAGAGIASAVGLIGRNRIAVLSVMWAYAGILLRHLSPSIGVTHPYVIIVAIGCEAILLTVLLIPTLLQRCRQNTSKA